MVPAISRPSAIRIILIWMAFFFTGTPVFSADNTAGTTAPVSIELTKQAGAYERSGEKLKAAATYEELVKTDPAKRLVVAHRLVRLYAALCNTNRALQWAEVVMERNPDPQAYLAGVYSMVGKHEEARAILEVEIPKAKRLHRKVTLHWQLADVYEVEGNAKKAEELLASAVELVKGRKEESAANRRLEKFRKKHKRPGKKDGH